MIRHFNSSFHSYPWCYIIFGEFVHLYLLNTIKFGLPFSTYSEKAILMINIKKMYDTMLTLKPELHIFINLRFGFIYIFILDLRMNHNSYYQVIKSLNHKII